MRRRRLASPVLGVASVVQTTPSLALFGFLIPLPLLGGVGAREAALGMGMTGAGGLGAYIFRGDSEDGGTVVGGGPRHICPTVPPSHCPTVSPGGALGVKGEERLAEDGVTTDCAALCSAPLLSALGPHYYF
ncbi:MAG TPA: hypothetical protein VNL98_00730 [Gemmatimonadales bacterium]|nr:hypothetical protein [Gemmatimonadales bacterium]